MTEEQQAAYVISQVACAQIEAAGMTAENQQRAALGHSMAYDEAAFDGLIEKYGIHSDGVLTVFGR